MADTVTGESEMVIEIKVFKGQELEDKILQARKLDSFHTVKVENVEEEIIDMKVDQETRVNLAIEKFENSLDNKPKIRTKYFSL